MTDMPADDEPLILEDDKLPWLEAVEDDEPSRGPSAMKMVAAVVIGLVAIGLIVGGLFWMGGNRDAGSGTGEPELIAAPEGDYKQAPADAGGMQVEGKGDSAFAASEGADPKGNIDVAALPETPVTKAPESKPASKQPAPAPKQQPAAPAPVATGPAIQLGAFSSQSGANNAWKKLSGRFAYLAPLSHSVMPANVGGRTLYRLRASGPNAANLCGRLRVAGETCVTVD